MTPTTVTFYFILVSSKQRKGTKYSGLLLKTEHIHSKFMIPLSYFLIPIFKLLFIPILLFNLDITTLLIQLNLVIKGSDITKYSV